MRIIRTAILISGTGSNMMALVRSLSTNPKARVVLVAADTPRAKGLAKGLIWAKRKGLATLAPETLYKETDLIAALQQAKVDLVLLAGFMRILSSGFISIWPQRILNIHPSLLPDFPGLNTHQRAIDARVKTHGCTVHFVDAGTDTGPVIGQAAVEVLEQDTAETLAARVLEQEHRLYPQIVERLIAELTAGPGPESYTGP